VNKPAPAGSIRIAGASDAAAVLAIYAPIVADTAISFEVTSPSEAALAARIESCNEAHRWLVAEAAGGIAGYAYGTSHRARHAYRYSVETSVYVHPAHHGRGVGLALYERLFEDLADLGYFHAFAAITLPNDASTGLHARAGFRHIGTFPNVGFKFGRWHDVSWWHRTLRPGMPVEAS
jgi:phosphinothricin acetyltransferase